MLNIDKGIVVYSSYWDRFVVVWAQYFLLTDQHYFYPFARFDIIEPVPENQKNGVEVGNPGNIGENNCNAKNHPKGS